MKVCANDDRFGASEHGAQIENGFPQTAALPSELTNLLQAGLLTAGVGLEPTTNGLQIINLLRLGSIPM